MNLTTSKTTVRLSWNLHPMLDEVIERMNFLDDSTKIVGEISEIEASWEPMEAEQAGDPQTNDFTCTANTIEENTVRSEPAIGRTLEPISTDVLDTEI